MATIDYTPYNRIDNLLLIELRESDMISGIIPKLYEIVRDEAPLSYLTAKAFVDRPGAKVGIVTGAEAFKNMPKGEIDGLPGAVFLGRALSLLGHEVHILADGGCVAPLQALVKGFNVANVKVIDATAISEEEVLTYAGRMDIGVAIEKGGVNRKGLRHTIKGMCYESQKPRQYADKFILRLNEQGKMTIGYGDGGNEIGMGKIFHRVRDIVPYGAKCQCPCGDGMATIIPTELLWPVNVSNFGAYGTVAGLAILTGKQELAMTPAELLKALDICVAEGVVDGGSGLPKPGEDGISAEAAAAYVQLMKSIVEKAFSKWTRAF